MKLFENLVRDMKIFSSLKTYKHKSIFFRFWMLIMLGFAVVFATVLFMLNNYSDTKYYNNITKIFSTSMYNTGNTLDTVFSEIISDMQIIPVYPEIIEAKEKKPTEEVTMKMEAVLRGLHSESEYIKSVYIYYPKTNYILSSSMIYPSDDAEKFGDMSWHGIYYDGSSEILLREYTENGVTKRCISVCKKISGDSNAIAVFNINYDKFNFMHKKNFTMDYELSMVNDDGHIIYSTVTARVGRSILELEDISDIYFKSKENYSVNSDIGRETIVESIRIRNVKLTVIAEILKKNVDDMNSSRRILTVISVVLAVLLIFLSIFLAIKFYSSIVKVFERIPDFGTAKPDSGATNEITDISNRISDIVNKRYEAESELAESLMQLQKAQTIALQSQFNPHFLFNSLQMINSIALVKMDGDSDITTAVSLLCDILHQAMDTTEYTCTLREEIGFAEKYICLQNMKYDNVFKVTYDIDEDVLDTMVVKLFLQPILENSMHHGYDGKRSEMNISVAAHIIDGKMVVSVMDDGVGMTEERECEMAVNLSNKQLEKKDSIGLLNLNQRVQLIFGMNCGCSIKNNEEKGVTVSVSFPV